MGVRAEFYDPTDLSALAAMIRPETRMIWVETPGSATMELQDIPAIVALAKPRGIFVGCDNTWATALGIKPLLMGVDVVAEALSKYAGGHSDILMGSITTASEELGLRVKALAGRFGIGVSPDDVSLVMRGIETLPIRHERSGSTALGLARWLEQQGAVARVLHPALPSHSGHRIWSRDHHASSGVFSICTKVSDLTRIAAALDELTVFSIGASWGGTRSLIVPVRVPSQRSATGWDGPEYILRLGIGMEPEDELRADLTRLLSKLQDHDIDKAAQQEAATIPNMEKLS